MSEHLPVVSGRLLVRALERIGYVAVRQRGSHIRMRHPSDPRRQPTSVVDSRELKRGLLRSILRDASLSPEELRELL